jgi:sigma-E factor negative regulatory protein RseB
MGSAMSTRATAPALLVLVMSTGILPAMAGENSEARAWLERMSDALATRNYDGKFFHLRNEQSETLRIIHRVEGGSISERLIALDGSGREIIRNESEVICYLPDRKLVLVEKRTGDEPLFGTLPSYSAGLDDHYDIEAGKTTKVLGRKTQMISVKPRDEYRYGYRLWLDYETAMPLKSQLCDRDGKVIEEILFAQLDLPEHIPAESIKPETSAEGFRWFRQAVLPVAAAGSETWQVPKLPSGFKLTNRLVQAATGSNAEVQHLVFSDGLASVSVFIEPQPRSAVPLHGLTRMGSAFAFSTEVHGHQVTAVGEVPAVTVQTIGKAVEARNAGSKPARSPAPAASPPAAP